MATSECKSKVFVDISEVVRVLCAVGFSIRHIDACDQSDVTPTGTPGQKQRGGCRVVVTCTTSGLRAVLETVGEECGCSIQHLTTAADNKTVGVDVMKNSPSDHNTESNKMHYICCWTETEKLIAPFSDSAALSLRELLIKIKKHDNEHKQTASLRTCDVSESSSSYNELQEQRHKSEFLEYVGLGSRNAASISLDNLSTSSDLGHSLRKDKEISSCPPSPAVRDDTHLGVPHFPSMETLASPKVSETTCGALCPSSGIRKEGDIEKKLKLAAACIQEVLALHCRESTTTRTTSSLFKVPSVPGSKRKTTTNLPQAESHKCASEKSIKPRPLTPLPVKKTKASVSDKPSILRTPNPSGTGRTNLWISRW